LKYKFTYDKSLYQLATETKNGSTFITTEEGQFEFEFESVTESVFILNINNSKVKTYAVRDGNSIFLNIYGRHIIIDDVSREDDQDFSGDQGDSVNSAIAPMPGSVLKVLVNEGDEVNFDQPLAIIEAMKMENEVRAPRDAIVQKVVVEEGVQVGSGDDLILFES